MTWNLIEAPTEDAFTIAATAHLAGRIQHAIQENGHCTIGLSGGGTPKRIYEALGQITDIDWFRVTLFLVDERHIRKDSPKSNQFLLRSTLLRHATIPESQLLFPDTSLPIDACVKEYGAVLDAVFAKHAPDIIVLGMGDDGHIASLFPPLKRTKKSGAAIHTTTDRFDITDRISVTLAILSKANEALVLLTGKEKKKAWEDMLQSTKGSSQWPLKAILGQIPTTVFVHW